MKANYREVKGQPYTKKEYDRGLHPFKITNSTMGDTETEHSADSDLTAHKFTRSSARFLILIPCPPHFLIFGAHADLLQYSMRSVFGKHMLAAVGKNPSHPVPIIGTQKEKVDATKRDASKTQSSRAPNIGFIIGEKQGTIR